MYHKRDLRLHFERILLLLKAQKLAAFVPILLINILIPFLNITIYFSKGIGDELTMSIYQLLQAFVPFISSWWIIFTLKFFVEEKGSEILFVNSDKSKLFDLCTLFFVMLFDICITSLPYFWMTQRFDIVLLKLILVCVFYFGVSYFFTLLTNSIMPTLLLLLVYTLANVLAPFRETNFPFYYSPEMSTNLLFCELPLCITGILLIVCGIFRNRNFKF